MRQWNHETRKEEKKEGEDIEKKAVLSLPLYPWTKEGTGGEDIGRAIKLTSDETQGTLLENGLRGEQDFEIARRIDQVLPSSVTKVFRISK